MRRVTQLLKRQSIFPIEFNDIHRDNAQSDGPEKCTVLLGVLGAIEQYMAFIYIPVDC